MGYEWGKRSKKRAEAVSPLLFDYTATTALSVSQYDMTIARWGGVRPASLQNEIYREGYSHKDGYQKLSYHQASPPLLKNTTDLTGKALDIIPVNGGYANTKAFRHFARCMFWAWQDLIYQGVVPQGVHLEWGGHWTNFVDLPHWQIVMRK